MTPLLEVEHLTVTFERAGSVLKAVDDLTLTIEAGETLGLVGESGSGKSVTALAILRLLQPPGRVTSGRILFEGRDLLGLPETEMRSVRGGRISLIFQEPMTALNPTMRVGEQIAEALTAHGIGRDEARQRSVELLDAVRIPDPGTRVRDFPHQLSGGMRQRVMIAMSLSCNPKLLIADEPTTALDVTIQAQILDIMARLSRELGTAVVVITHNLGVVARYADRVNVMYAGKIVESGSAADIFKRPRHPYTVGLMSSVPRLDATEHVRLTTIEGQPPLLIDPIPGCPFEPRCDWRIEKCHTDAPPLELKAEHHWAACWRNPSEDPPTVVREETAVIVAAAQSLGA